MRGEAAASSETAETNSPPIALAGAGTSPVGASTRLDAIAKLRRAASQREIQQSSSPSRIPSLPSIQQIDDSVKRVDEPHYKPPIAQFQLPSLEQLRQRIIQERRPTGLSRSASTSATSQVARAYTMQKLLGATTPISYADMFAFVRDTNKSRGEIDTVTSDEDVSVHAVQDTSGPGAGVSLLKPRRATLMRSVSARNNARMHLYRRHGRTPQENALAPGAITPIQGSPPMQGSGELAASDDGSTVAHDSNSTSSWRVSLYDYDSTSPIVSPPYGLAPISSAPIVPRAVDGVAALPPVGQGGMLLPGERWLRETSVATAPHQQPAASDENAGTRKTSEAEEAREVRETNETRKAKEAKEAEPVREASEARRADKAANAPHAPYAPDLATPPSTLAAPKLTRVTSHTAQLDTQVPRSGKVSEKKAEPMQGVSVTPSPSTPTIPAAANLPAVSIPWGDPSPEAPAAHVISSVPSSRVATPVCMSPSLSHDDGGQKPLPRLPSSAQLPPVPPLPEPRGEHRLGDSLYGAQLRQSPTPSLEALPTVPKPLLHTRSFSTGGSSSSSSGFPREDVAADDPKKEARVMRLFGSLRRKTSRRALGSLRRQAKVPSTDPSHVAMASIVLLGESGESVLHDKVVTLPVTPAALMRWNQTLPRPLRHVLARLPAEMPLDLAMDPPRQLLRVLPLLQTAGDEYVKLRYVFVFQDMMVVAKPVVLPRQGESLSDFIIRKLASVPDLSESCTPFAVLDLQHTCIDEGSSLVERAAKLDALVRQRITHLHVNPTKTLHQLMNDARLRGPEPRAYAQLLHSCTALDAGFVSDFLFANHAVLEQYVAQHCVAGAPLELALRALLASLRWPRDMPTFEVLLFAFAAHWHAANASEHAGLTLELTTDLTFALLGLNDALHDATGLFARPNPALSVDKFVMLFRVHDTQKTISDRLLSEVYLAIKTSPLTSTVSRDAWRAVSFDADALCAEPLKPGVPSAPVRVSLDAPDSDVRIRLVGRGLYIDPPVLSFTHAAHAEFSVCATTPGSYDLLFLRTGRHAARYMNEQHQPMQSPLPRHLPLVCETSTARPTIKLVHMPPGSPRTDLTFCMTDPHSAEQVASFLRASMETAHADALRLTQAELDVRTLCRLVLESALLAPDSNDTRRRACRSSTGTQIVRTARENSLLAYVLLSTELRRVVT